MSEENTGKPRRIQWSVRGLLVLALFVALSARLVVALRQLNRAEMALAQLRLEVGYLPESVGDGIAAVRVPSDLPLTYQFRIRVPDTQKYRVAYSSIWERDRQNPHWFAAIDVPPGESVVTVRVMEDPRDERWKIATLVRSDRGTKRIATALLPEHVAVFRGTHDAISMGVKREMVVAAHDSSIRLLDERWLAGESGLMLYGDKPPAENQIGVYAELQVDVGTL